MENGLMISPKGKALTHGLIRKNTLESGWVVNAMGKGS